MAPCNGFRASTGRNQLPRSLSIYAGFPKPLMLDRRDTQGRPIFHDTRPFRYGRGRDPPYADNVQYSELADFSTSGSNAPSGTFTVVHDPPVAQYNGDGGQRGPGACSPSGPVRREGQRFRLRGVRKVDDGEFQGDSQDP